MANSDDSDVGCMKALASCLRNRGKKSAKHPVAATASGCSASPTSDIREPIQLSPTTVQTPTALPIPSSIQTAAKDQLIIENPHQEDEGDTVTVSAEASVKVETPTNPGFPNTTKLDLWQEAYDELDDKTRAWVGDVSAFIDVKATTDELVMLVRESEEKHKGATPKLKIGNREIIWRDYANRVVTGLTSIGDIAITFAPAPSSAVWSGIKVLMKANVSQCEDLTAILGCTDIVLSLARRGRVYEEVYIGETPTTDVQEDLKQTLVRVYKKCLEFLAFVDARFKQNRLGSFLNSLLDPGQAETEVTAVRDLEKELDMATRPCQAQRSEAHDRLLRSLRKPLKRIDDKVATVLKRLEKAELEKVKETISSIPVGEQHGRIRQKRTPGTGEWLIQDRKRFLQWEQSSCSSVFWLQGKLGTGKSFLSSKVVDRYRSDDRDSMQIASQHDEGLAFFYCDRGDPAPLTSILRSYIRQLGEVPRRPEYVHEAMYKLHADEKNIQNHFSNETCKKALLVMINTYPRTTLILDGLDESSRDTRRDIIRVFDHLIREAEHVVKIFIASRVETDIEAEMESFQQLIYMDTLDNTGDIEKFVEQCISERKNWHISDDTKKEVKQRLSEKRDAMFRWTYLQWEKVKIAETNKEVMQLLKKLPGTLREAYDDIYDQKAPGSFELLVLQRAVRWVISAPEPLSSRILLPAIWAESQWKDENDDVIDQTDLNEAQLESICRHMITNDPHLEVWRFPHASVAEYFEGRSDLWLKDALAEVTTFLIRHLTKVCSNWPPPGLDGEDVLQRFPRHMPRDLDVSDFRHAFQIYTYQNWFLYVQSLRENNPKVSEVGQALKCFLGAAGPGQPSSREYEVYCEDILGHFSPFDFPKWRYYGRDVQPVQNFTFGIAVFGLHRVLAGWWDQDLDISLVNTGGRDLLAISAYYGYQDLCKSLVFLGFDANRPVNEREQSALGGAALSHDIEAITFLLQNEAKPNRVMQDGSLLCLAAACGTDAVRAFLDYGADPNISCGSECKWDYPLSRAAFVGDLEAVEALIRSKADINPVSFTDRYGIPLASAVFSDHLPVVRLLLNCGADVNASRASRNWGSILAIAIIMSTDTGMIEFLIEKASADTGVLTTSPPSNPQAIGKLVRGCPNGHKKNIRHNAAYLVGNGCVKAQVLKDIGLPEEFIPPDGFRGEWWEFQEEQNM
ncbi:hypothetical protein NW762_013891 [Fusarium torreyae]|uniref:Nephrocystin 3-like N-terminal domain-containing protein n=1 Tax=Fusarium torreyae TaxID=1237075 RepID=A0A9W8V9W9_9HYPO|nr:hypothetical protein NW762_013891 [Fusarium torreyae]